MLGDVTFGYKHSLTFTEILLLDLLQYYMLSWASLVSTYACPILGSWAGLSEQTTISNSHFNASSALPVQMNTPKQDRSLEIRACRLLDQSYHIKVDQI
jgi:hypothetical protein